VILPVENKKTLDKKTLDKKTLKRVFIFYKTFCKRVLNFCASPLTTPAFVGRLFSPVYFAFV